MVSSHRLAFWLSAVLQGVAALNAPQPYEIVYMYTAYKLEFQTVAKEQRKIAPGCEHQELSPRITAGPLYDVEQAFLADAAAAGLTGICSFYDFYRWVGSGDWQKALSGKDVPKRGQTDAQNRLTRTLYPDADALADEVNDITTIGKRALKLRPNRLFSQAFIDTLGGVAENIPYPTIIKEAGKVVEAARLVLEIRIKNNPADTALRDRVNTMVSTAVDLLSTTHKFRRGDQARFLVPDVRASPSWTGSALSNAGIGQVNTEDYINMAGENRPLIHWVPSVPPTTPPTGALVADQNFEVIDWAQSFQNAIDAGTPISDEDKHAALSYYQNYGTDPANAQAKEHRDVLDVVSGTRNLHQRPITLEPVTPPPPPPADPEYSCPSCCVQ